jgi:hypothetical protein
MKRIAPWALGLLEAMSAMFGEAFDIPVPAA